MINRNKNKLQPKTGGDLSVDDPNRGSARDRSGVTNMKQKAVRQLLEQTLFQKRIKQKQQQSHNQSDMLKNHMI